MSECPVCGDEYIKKSTGDVKWSEQPEESGKKDFCPEYDEDGKLTVYWH